MVLTDKHQRQHQQHKGKNWLGTLLLPGLVVILLANYPIQTHCLHISDKELVDGIPSDWFVVDPVVFPSSQKKASESAEVKRQPTLSIVGHSRWIDQGPKHHQPPRRYTGVNGLRRGKRVQTRPLRNEVMAPDQLPYTPYSQPTPQMDLVVEDDGVTVFPVIQNDEIPFAHVRYSPGMIRLRRSFFHLDVDGDDYLSMDEYVKGICGLPFAQCSHINDP